VTALDKNAMPKGGEAMRPLVRTLLETQEKADGAAPAFSLSDRQARIGKVYLVDAGPGDPLLLALRGKQCLEQADVVVYDYLANKALLDYAPSTAEKLYVGKSASRHTKGAGGNQPTDRRAQPCRENRGAA